MTFSQLRQKEPRDQTPDVPLIVDGSVHLGLQLVGASADGPAVTTSPLDAGVLLEVLPARRGEGSGGEGTVEDKTLQE